MVKEGPMLPVCNATRSTSSPTDQHCCQESQGVNANVKHKWYSCIPWQWWQEPVCDLLKLQPTTHHVTRRGLTGLLQSSVNRATPSHGIPDLWLLPYSSDNSSYNCTTQGVWLVDIPSMRHAIPYSHTFDCACNSKNVLHIQFVMTCNECQTSHNGGH